MRLDIYRRAEREGHFSYLAVPEGKRIPEEATNTDWETVARGMDMEGDASEFSRFSIEQALPQIQEKGYAITSSKNLET
ncbi:MAG: DUF6139 family protein [Pseudomonadota bacterium]